MKPQLDTKINLFNLKYIKDIKIALVLGGMAHLNTMTIFFSWSSSHVTSAILYLRRAINGGCIANSTPSDLVALRVIRLIMPRGWMNGASFPSCRAALISATYGSSPTALRLSRQHGSAA